MRHPAAENTGASASDSRQHRERPSMRVAQRPRLLQPPNMSMAAATAPRPNPCVQRQRRALAGRAVHADCTPTPSEHAAPTTALARCLRRSQRMAAAGAQGRGWAAMAPLGAYLARWRIFLRLRLSRLCLFFLHLARICWVRWGAVTARPSGETSSVQVDTAALARARGATTTAARANMGCSCCCAT